ncbi:tetratricopeptide repeat protein [Blastochloris viridis]|uniref:tetratricopeptide repeat protein n=1 Tax=Blastochloris viridis TaxID=1079 RepID=UPI0011A084F8|nr:tetratricopeptide repeat protein [Blastochloris viridis]
MAGGVGAAAPLQAQERSSQDRANQDRANQDRVRVVLSAKAADGYGRLVFDFEEPVSPQVQVANGVVVITTARPIRLSSSRVEKLPSQFRGGYLAAARVDPDGRGIRLALDRKLTVNSMEAGEKLFIDLLPDGWTGLPPGLPQEVIDDLAKRALQAEKRVRQLGDQAKREKHVVKLHVAEAPTFSRFVFDVPSGLEILTHRDDNGFTTLFTGDVAVELGDSKGRLPPAVTGLDIDYSGNGAAVRLAVAPDVDVRSFREDASFSVDVTPPKGARAGAVAAVRAAQQGDVNAAPAPVERRRAADDPAARLEQLMPLEAANAKPVPQPAPPLPPQAAAAPPKPAAAPQSADAVAPPFADAPTKPPADTAAAPELPNTAARPAETPHAANPSPKPAPPTQAPAKAAAPIAPAKVADQSRPGVVAADMERQGSILKLNFPFTTPTAAAVFRRGESLWLVFDTDKVLDVTELTNDKSGTFREVQSSQTESGYVVRMRLARPWVVGAEAQGFAWSIALGEMVLEPTLPITPARQLADGRSLLALPLDGAHRVHRLSDPDAGDVILTATAPGPTRGISRNQEYVEFSLIATTHGVAVLPIADDLAVEALGDKVTVSRAGGLLLSAPGLSTASKRSPRGRPVELDPQLWGAERAEPFQRRLTELITAASEATDRNRRAVRFDLARFYLAQGFAAEARGVLDTLIGDSGPSDDAMPYLLRAMAWMNLGRNAEAMKDLAHPLLATSLDAAVLRGIVHTNEGRWREARENFAAAAGIVATLPIDMQRQAVAAATRAAVELRDFEGAARTYSEFETVGIPRELEGEVAVLAGRIAEGKGQPDEAMAAYQRAQRQEDSPPAAEARYRALAMRLAAGKVSRDEAINELEGLTVMWRGDRTELEGLATIGRLYVDAGRFRDGFRTLEAANISHPASDITRNLSQTMASAFADLFLEQRGDTLSAMEALGIFYDYRELVPVGRRGDEMIRRLADRLISVDLLEQAAELLSHQVEKRLQGAARAQVAAKLAMVYLKNRKPDLALKTLRATRLADLPNDIHDQRLLLEARATSEIGRHDLALELIEAQRGKDVDRLRADILWAAKRYGEAAEAIERAHGERWKSFAPLADNERQDVLTAAVGYALAEDKLGLERFRSRYAAKMADGPDRGAFDAVSNSFGLDTAELRDIARSVSSVNTLERFLRDYRERYDETKAPVGGPAELQPAEPQPAAPAAEQAPAQQSSAPTPARG